jgi:protein FAM32A
MAGDEYSVGGGKLKLKGSKVSGGRIEKKKKKSSKKKDEDSASGTPSGTPSGDATQKSAVEQNESLNRDSTPTDSRVEKRDDNDNDDGDKEREIGVGKTETERKYEEIRRKRVCFSSFSIFLFLSFHESLWLDVALLDTLN